jgi:hypothetical protein
MALLRDATGPIARERLLLVTEDARQSERCLASLVEDGLVEALDPAAPSEAAGPGRSAETPGDDLDLYALPT